MFEDLKIKDYDSAIAVMIENVFELQAGAYVNEPESNKELTSYNARTLALRFGEMNKGGTKLTCEYLRQINIPTLIVLGERTHKYWELMSRKFAECTPGTAFKILQGTNHKGPIEKVKHIC